MLKVLLGSLDVTGCIAVGRSFLVHHEYLKILVRVFEPLQRTPNFRKSPCLPCMCYPTCEEEVFVQLLSAFVAAEACFVEGV